MNTTLGRTGLLAILIAFACTANAANLVLNPGFEDNQSSFTVFPGYISGNTTISNWTANDATRVGINGNAGSGNPFANNGTKPDGVAVAFLQSSGVVSTLSQSIAGLSIGQTYQVKARVNSRNPSGTAAVATVTMGSSTFLNNQTISAVGGANPYQYLSFIHTAGATSETLTFQNSAAGDNTLLLDAVSVDPVFTTDWSAAAWNNNATSGISSTAPYSHAYSFGAATNPIINGVNFTGVAGANPAVVGKFSTSGLTDVFNNDANNVTDVGGSRTLANDFLYRGAVSSAPETITINGLKPGAIYRATIFGVGFDPGNRTATLSASGSNDRLTINENALGTDNGVRVSYTYTADNTGSVTLSAQPLDNSTSLHVYGFSNEVLSTVPITGLFNTGVDAGGTPLPDGTVGDPHWALISVPSGSTAERIRTSATGFPIGPWLGDNATSAWIGPNNDNALNGPEGSYTYRTTFNLDNSGSPAGRIQGLVAVDNSVTIFLNGVNVGTASGFGGFTPFDIQTGFQSGLNILDFVVLNGPGGGVGPTGLRVEFTNAQVIVPETSTLVLMGLGLGGMLGLRRRRVS